ncbi:MAG: ribosome silencing factor [Nitrospiraceae bacterium]
MAKACLEKKANDVLILHVAKLTSVTDYLVLCSGESERQVRAIADNVDANLSGQRVPPLSIEGAMAAQWILLDFGDVVVHVFRSDIRDHYGLERLWNDARRIRLPAQQAAAPAPPLRPAKRRSPRAREQR